MAVIAELSESGRKVFEARYAAKDETGKVTETFEDAVYRLARTAALAEPEGERAGREEEFAAAIGGLYFVPSTPIWANMGKDDRPWQPGACFVLGVEDSLESMYQTLKDTALVFKSGGGVGYNFSAIRPRGALVRSTKGQASGVVELIRLYDASSGMVMQGGVRRGASMGILNIDHPEIIHFIQSKREGDITHFNLSVGVTDAFMEALERDAEWPLVFNGRVYETVRARELWELIAEAAHACGDPGVVFIDRLQRDNPVPDKVINATNPCVVGDTWVTTSEGPRQVRELVGRRFQAVVNGVCHQSGPEGFFFTGTRPVVRLRTREGFSLRLTADHKILRVTSKTRCRMAREWVAAGELKPGDRIVLHNHREMGHWPGMLSESEGYLLSCLVGDGILKQDSAILSVYGMEKTGSDSVAQPDNGIQSVIHRITEYAKTLPHRSFNGWSTIRGCNEHRLKMSAIRDLAKAMGMRPGYKTVTARVEAASSDGYRGFLRGLFDADGTVIGGQVKEVSVRLAQSDLKMLQAVQRMLLRLGIVSTIYSNRRPAGTRYVPDSRRNLKGYTVKAQHELVISKDNLRLFAERVGFTNKEKADKLKSLLASYRRSMNRERFIATVVAVEGDGIEDVYDVQIPGVNAFDANGIYVHNCGEQPLSPGESCLLGSVNLAKMMRREGERWAVDWDLLRETVATGMRFLDNIIDVADYPLEFIAEATRATRKVGLGYTGLHDMLIRVGLAYDSEEGRRFAGRVVEAVQEAAHDYSRELAEERGCFPDWERSVFFPHDKRRNAACITVAPTGSVTTIAGCEGYGIEPIFAVAYTKATDVAGSFEVFSPLFLEACAAHNVPRAVLSEVARRGSCQGVEGIPEEIARIFKGAQEISPQDHILMQAEIQRRVDNATSKTINLPNSATIHDVETCYRLAWELNLKGITVFRDGCKEGVITVGKKKRRAPRPDELGRGEILPRPESAHGVTHRLDTGCGKIYLTVNYQPENGEILETFITTGSDGGCLIYTEATSRLISLAIRGGIPVEEIIEQLQSTHSCPSYLLARGRGKKLSPGKSCASAIARKLIEIQSELRQRCNGVGKTAACAQVADPDAAPDVCEICGVRMKRAEGCFVCPNCGFAKC